jgi:hypothetical protein
MKSEKFGITIIVDGKILCQHCFRTVGVTLSHSREMHHTASFNVTAFFETALKHQLSTQHYELSTTAHVVRKLLTVVVAFRTTIPNRPSIITLFGCFRCLDFWIKDLLLYLINLQDLQT